MLINVKMPTIVGILTFIRMMNTKSEFESMITLYFQHFSFDVQLNFFFLSCCGVVDKPLAL